MERSGHDITGSNAAAMTGEPEQKQETYQPMDTETPTK
jgi:hypothetical protein